jgi:hypothetical protein
MAAPWSTPCFVQVATELPMPASIGGLTAAQRIGLDASPEQRIRIAE